MTDEAIEHIYIYRCHGNQLVTSYSALPNSFLLPQWQPYLFDSMQLLLAISCIQNLFTTCLIDEDPWLAPSWSCCILVVCWILCIVNIRRDMRKFLSLYQPFHFPICFLAIWSRLIIWVSFHRRKSNNLETSVMVSYSLILCNICRRVEMITL